MLSVTGRGYRHRMPLAQTVLATVRGTADRRAPPRPVRVERRPVDEAESRRANGPDWDRYADEYQATHGAFLGDVGFVWGPEGLTEAEAGILGDVAGQRRPRGRLAAPASARAGCRAQGGRAVRPGPVVPAAPALPAHRRRDRCRRCPRCSAPPPPCRSRTTPSTSSSPRSAPCSSSRRSRTRVAETARVLRPGGRFAFSITHPTRWMFPDDPDEPGLVASQSYWDRTPYVEVDDETGAVAYVEHHRTLGDWVGLLAGHGFVITDLLEPEWPEGHDRVWGGWSGIRGRLTPGTAIFGATLR